MATTTAAKKKSGTGDKGGGAGKAKGKAPKAQGADQLDTDHAMIAAATVGLFKRAADAVEKKLKDAGYELPEGQYAAAFEGRISCAITKEKGSAGSPGGAKIVVKDWKITERDLLLAALCCKTTVPGLAPADRLDELLKFLAGAKLREEKSKTDALATAEAELAAKFEAFAIRRGLCEEREDLTKPTGGRAGAMKGKANVVGTTSVTAGEGVQLTPAPINITED